jgi:hypothetical protein
MRDIAHVLAVRLRETYVIKTRGDAKTVSTDDVAGFVQQTLIETLFAEVRDGVVDKLSMDLAP